MLPSFLDTPWARLLLELSQLNDGIGPCLSSREGKLFRRRFRVPFQFSQVLANKAAEQKLFGPNSCDSHDLCGRLICPIEIKLLGVLRIIGRNWCFDDVAEAAGMGEMTVHEMFYMFCENNYDTYIHRPEGQELGDIS